MRGHRSWRDAVIIQLWVEHPKATGSPKEAWAGLKGDMVPGKQRGQAQKCQMGVLGERARMRGRTGSALPRVLVWTRSGPADTTSVLRSGTWCANPTN